MKLTLILAVAVLLAAAHDPTDLDSPSSTQTLGTPAGPALNPRALETPATEVCLADIAPNFSYQSVDGRWRRLSDIVAQGPVLLVFGADELVLRVLEHERESLMNLGVIPVAVMGTRVGAARAIVNRHQLRFTVLGDPQGVIAAQFNALDPSDGRHLPAWFVLDAKRRVRGLERKSLPVRGYAARAAEALGLPTKDRPVSTSK